MDEPVIHFETLAVANMILTRKLLGEVVRTKAIDEETLIGIFQSAADEMVRSTLPISKEGAIQVLSLFTGSTGIEKGTIFTDD
ncbi:hypothetical protein ACOTCJ_20890 [Achromobacter xylosoxidans]